MEKTSHILYGILIGLILPISFIWLYLYNFYPEGNSVWEAIVELYPGSLFGKLLILSIIPNLILTFVFYKKDRFKLGSGVICGAIPYLITSIFMFN